MLSHATLLLAAVLAVPGQPAAAAPPAGNWKVIFPLQSDPTQALWLLKLEQKDGKWTATLLDSAQDVPKATVEDLKVDKERVRFTLKLPSQSITFEGRLPPDKDNRIL